MDRVYLKKIVEAVLLVSDKPVNFEQMHEVFPEIKLTLWDEVIQQLRAEYSDPGRGIQLAEVAGGFQLCTAPECGEFLKRLYKTRRVVRLSGPALETLAIIAYKQPATRAEIEFVRGVNVDGVIKTLEERGLITERGKKEVPGRPIMYATTEDFLHYFGLKSLADLPPLEAYQIMEGMDSEAQALDEGVRSPAPQASVEDTASSIPPEPEKAIDSVAPASLAPAPGDGNVLEKDGKDETEKFAHPAPGY